MTNQQFSDRLIAEFGQGARQRPMLDPADATVGARALLAPIAQASSGSATAAAAPWGDSRAETIQALQLVIQKLKTP